MASWAVAPRPATALQTPQRQTLGSPALASTGKATSTPASAATTDSPSNWRHPRIDEINQRRAATVFDETNLMTVIYNSVAFVLLYLARNASGMPFKQLRRLCVSLDSLDSLFPIIPSVLTPQGPLLLLLRERRPARRARLRRARL